MRAIEILPQWRIQEIFQVYNIVGGGGVVGVYMSFYVRHLGKQGEAFATATVMHIVMYRCKFILT